MVRETSVEAYKDLVNSGAISKKRGEVLLYVAANPDCTAWDCEEYLQPRNRSTVNARFSELVHRGYIEETGFKVQNQHKRITYRVTGNLNPPGFRKKLTWQQKFNILKELCEDLGRNPVLPTEIKALVQVNLDAVSDRYNQPTPVSDPVPFQATKPMSRPTEGGVLNLW